MLGVANVGRFLSLLLVDPASPSFWGVVAGVLGGLVVLYVAIAKVWSIAKDARKLHQSEVKTEIEERTELSDRQAAGWRSEWDLCRATLATAKETIAERDDTIKEKDTVIIMLREEIGRYEAKARDFAAQHESLIGKVDVISKQVAELARHKE